jgi:UDP-2,3-diacylglucosamine pyrophosphatase LpxH
MTNNGNKSSIKERIIYLRSNYTKNESEIARIINNEYFGGDESNFMKCRSRVRRALGTHTKGMSENKKKSTPRVAKKAPQVQEKFVLSAINPTTKKLMDIEEYCEYHNLPIEDIKDRKLVTHTGTPYWNIHWKNSIVDALAVIDEDLIKKTVQKYAKPVKFKKLKYQKPERIIRTIYTDVHIAMCPNPTGHSLFGGVWNEKELMKRMKHMAKDTVYRAKKEGADMVFIDELGDFMDGWKGKTVRQEHDIPQNMSTEDAFDLGVKFKVQLADLLVDSGQFSSIVFNNICNDNHAGTFGYVVNSAVKSILEIKYPKLVKVNNFKKFINHYTVGDHCFMICHGKDDKHLKFGFKPILDDKQAMKIDQYMKDQNLYKTSDFFEFSKGDSHQMVFDYSTSDDFNYMNYPAFSPSSDWVQTNFKKGRSGYVIQAFSPDSEDIDVFPATFKWKR